MTPDQIKFTVRRRMAISAFAHMALVILGVFIISYANPEAAKSLAEFNSIIIAVIGADTTIIGAYIGSATLTDGKLIGHNRP